MNQLLNLQLLRVLLYRDWSNFKHKKVDIICLAREIGNIGCAENKEIALDILAMIPK